MAKNHDEKYYTVAEVARLLRIKEDTVRSWLRNGQLRGIKVGKRVWRISSASLQRFLQNNEH